MCVVSLCVGASAVYQVAPGCQGRPTYLKDVVSVLDDDRNNETAKGLQANGNVRLLRKAVEEAVLHNYGPYVVLIGIKVGG